MSKGFFVSGKTKYLGNYHCYGLVLCIVVLEPHRGATAIKRGEVGRKKNRLFDVVSIGGVMGCVSGPSSAFWVMNSNETPCPSVPTCLEPFHNAHREGVRFQRVPR